MRAAKVRSDESNGGQSKIDSRGGTLLLSGDDIVSIAVKRFPMQQSLQRPKGLGTDSDIGGRAGIQPGATRQLQQVGVVCVCVCAAGSRTSGVSWRLCRALQHPIIAPSPRRQHASSLDQPSC